MYGHMPYLQCSVNFMTVFSIIEFRTECWCCMVEQMLAFVPRLSFNPSLPPPATLEAAPPFRRFQHPALRRFRG